MDDLEEIITSKRHEELLSVLQEISRKLSEKQDPQIGLLSKDIKLFLSRIEKTSNSERENIFASELEKLSATLQESIEGLKPPKTSNNWVFQIYRNSQGFIESVSANKK